MKDQIFSDNDIDFEAYYQGAKIKSAVKSASIYVQGLIDETNHPTPANHRYMPWHTSHELLQFRPGETTVWAGENGGGKSLITGQVALSLAEQGDRVAIGSFEMKPMRTMGRMGRQFTGLIHNDMLVNSNPESKEMVLAQYAKFRDWCKGKLWLYDKQGSVEHWQTIIAMARYAAQELKCKHVFIDNLGKVIPEEDDYNGQKRFINDVCALAQDEDIHAHIVHHVKKPEKEGAKGNKYAIKGTGAITDQPDNVIIVHRNKAKEHDRTGKLKDEADTILIVDKQRNGEGTEGELWLWYDKSSQQYLARPGDDLHEFV